MSRRMHSGKDSERITSDGTAARTRPLSIRDIMLRREKKSASEAKKTKEVLQDNYKDKSNHLEPGPETRNENKSRKDLKDIPVEGSKKANIKDTPGEGSKRDDLRHTPGEASKKDDLRHTPREGSKMENKRYTSRDISKKDNLKDRPKDSSTMDGLKDTPNVPRKDGKKDAPKKGSKKERSSTRDDSHLVDKDKNIHNSRKHSTSMSGRGDERRSANPGEITARNAGTKTSESQKGSGKRWNDETANNYKIKERSEKLQNGAKRKHDAFDDEKGSQVGRSMFKKHAQFRDFKHSDRDDGRKEYAKLHHEEPRSKRRRSRSRDHDRERRERSVSLSPRDQRHGYRGHDRDNYPPYHSMDRRHAEADRHKTSGNGGYNGGPYWRNESRLGGYSPRKRKTSQRDEHATTKAASPVNRSPEKKSATWDQRPVGEDQSNFFTALHPTVSQMDSSVPVNFTASKQGPKTTLETILSGSSLAVDSVQLTQATRPLRRLHIENLPSSATEDLLIGCLNEFLLSSGVNHIERSKQPCLSCTINKEKCQAFVEFLTPEDATAALSFDGRSFNGSSLKIRRPKEYVEMAQVAPKKPVEEIKLVSDIVADSPHKIFIAGISGVISSEMLMEIVSAFGPLAAYRFLFNEDIDGACAFLEYIDHSITSKACAGLNGMKLGGCILTAVYVFPNPPEEAGNEASAFYGVPDNAKSLLAKPTKVLQLKNVFDQEEYLLLSKSELEETLEDVRMECARFGAVKSINVVEYPANRGNAAEDLIVEPKDGSGKIILNECGGNDNFMETGLECSVLNQSRDVPGQSDTSETKVVDSIPDSLDHKELGALCDAPAATDKHTDQRAEANQMDSVEAHHDAIAVDDDSLDKEDAEPGKLEICSSTASGDGADKTGRENKQQGDNEMSEGNTEKVPETDTASGDGADKTGRENKQQGDNEMSEGNTERVPETGTRDSALVSNTSALEAGCILVEFMRKEAACMAAHSLHGRRFGNRIVSAGYAPHDLYLQKYPR